MTISYEQQDLLSYRVPKLTPDGTCSADKGLEEAPYDLRDIFHVSDTRTEKRLLEKIGKLHSLLDNVHNTISADWIGIYQVATNNKGLRVLVKLAYQGVPSRAEFPLTPEFAELSNNSTVGLTGKPVIIQSVKSHQGSYYNCDAAVNSEACLPIFAQGTSDVVGIIDVESFAENHFTREKIDLLEKFCEQLSEYLPLNF